MAGPFPVRYISVVLLLLLTTAFLYSRGTFTLQPGSSPTPNTSAGYADHANPTGPLDLRILPLGDSVTYAYNDPTGNGYRYFLECLLSSSGHRVQYTGSHRHGDYANDRNHGLSLHTTKLINANITAEAAAGEAGLPTLVQAPNVVLTHAGSVNMMQGGVDADECPEQLAALLDTVAAAWPRALHVVAQIAPMPDLPTQRRIGRYNARVTDVVRRKRWQGHNVLLASMTDLGPEENVDTVHPNGTAYRKMAQRWFEVVADAVGRGLVPELDAEARREVEAQHETDGPALARCDYVMQELQEKGEVVHLGEVVGD